MSRTSIATILAGEGTLPAPEAGAASAASPDPVFSVDALARARDLDELERIRRAVYAAGEAVYHWDIATDRLSWAGEAARTLNLPEPVAIGSGRAYARLLHRESLTSRFETIMRSSAADDGEGVPYSIEYELRPHGHDDPRSCWVEDSGRWYAGPDGRPAEAYGVVKRIDDRHQRDQHLRYLGSCDPLTGMMNRGRLAEALSEVVAAALRDGTSFVFLVAAVNNLPVVNDAYGFEIADEVIVAIARRLRQVVRTGDSIGRYSGSKFGLILANCSESDVEIAAERFLGAARDSVIEASKGPVWATLSIGGIVLPKHASDASMALARAEEALAEAKRQPTDSFVLYRPSPERASARGLNARFGAEILSSLREDRLTLAYQPIVDARTGEVAMHEALLRLIDPEGEQVEAAHLVPVAEKLGLVRLIDRAVLGLATNELQRNPSARISLNISGITATDPRWSGLLTEILRENPSVADRLMIEITETVALNDLNQTTFFIDQLRELGCKVAIDDFGAGYTSFRNLRILNVDMVKIDGSFCQNLAENPENQHFVRSFIDLARKFGLRTIAEWVQLDSDAELLREWGVDYLQGNLFGGPKLPLEPVASETFEVADAFQPAPPDGEAAERLDEPQDSDTLEPTDATPPPANGAVEQAPNAAPPEDLLPSPPEPAEEASPDLTDTDQVEATAPDTAPEDSARAAPSPAEPPAESAPHPEDEPEVSQLRQALAALDAFRAASRNPPASTSSDAA